jgi:hypothetical protein
MPSASTLRVQIEHALERRFPAALTPVPHTVPETAPTGIARLDRLLDGGLPVGAISEVAGPESSGRTSLALSFLAGRTREGLVCAWVDAGDALDAESAAASGVDLRQLLWVRCRGVGPIAHGPDRAQPWPRLDQALRATDLLLQAGGFAALVLDLGGTAPEHGARIPLATWFRFRQAAAQTRCSLLVLAREPLAQSSAEVVLECAPLAGLAGGGTVLSGLHYEVRIYRQRFMSATAGLRKPPASTWQATGAWQREERGSQQHGAPSGRFSLDGVGKQVFVAGMRIRA